MLRSLALPCTKCSTHDDAKPKSITNNFGGNVLTIRNNPQCIAIDSISPMDLTHHLLRLWVLQLVALYENKEKQPSRTGLVHVYKEAPMRSLCCCANHKLVIIFTPSFLFLYSYYQYRTMDTKINTRFLTFNLGGLGRYSFSLWPWQQTDLSTLLAHTWEICDVAANIRNIVNQNDGWTIAGWYYRKGEIVDAFANGHPANTGNEITSDNHPIHISSLFLTRPSCLDGVDKYPTTQAAVN